MDLEIKFYDMLKIESGETLKRSIEQLKKDYESKINNLIEEYNDMVVEYQKKLLLKYTFESDETNKKDFNQDEYVLGLKNKENQIYTLKNEYKKLCNNIKLNYELKVK
ncbi:hypothetical protein [Clostridium perfringens]|uniref:hypothetical protein n=1 Tax=Clostridium perfringens TaxID=1502 RepID=UPI0018E4C96A|nr:hypothetical protein [Clostridium perfringens]MBI5996811.1 hypothetical protein [Clostridium perfringens]